MTEARPEGRKGGVWHPGCRGGGGGHVTVSGIPVGTHRIDDHVDMKKYERISVCLAVCCSLQEEQKDQRSGSTC